MIRKQFDGTVDPSLINVNSEEMRVLQGENCFAREELYTRLVKYDGRSNFPPLKPKCDVCSVKDWTKYVCTTTACSIEEAIMYKNPASKVVDECARLGAKVVIYAFIGKFCEAGTHCEEQVLEQTLCGECQVKRPRGRLIRSCSFCHNVDIPLRQCAGCKFVAYCSKECQRRHWKGGHKRLCANMKSLWKTEA